MNTTKKSYFDNIPKDILRGFADGIYLGSQTFEHIKSQEPNLFTSLLAKDISTRLYSKVIQHAIVTTLPKTYTSIKNLGFGQNIAQISGDDFLIHVCYTKNPSELPCKSKYKLENALSNPHGAQLSMFAPPIANWYIVILYTYCFCCRKQFRSIYFASRCKL